MVAVFKDFVCSNPNLGGRWTLFDLRILFFSGLGTNGPTRFMTTSDLAPVTLGFRCHIQIRGPTRVLSGFGKLCARGSPAILAADGWLETGWSETSPCQPRKQGPYWGNKTSKNPLISWQVAVGGGVGTLKFPGRYLSFQKSDLRDFLCVLGIPSSFCRFLLQKNIGTRNDNVISYPSVGHFASTEQLRRSSFIDLFGPSTFSDRTRRIRWQVDWLIDWLIDWFWFWFDFVLIWLINRLHLRMQILVGLDFDFWGVKSQNWEFGKSLCKVLEGVKSSLCNISNTWKT